MPAVNTISARLPTVTPTRMHALGCLIEAVLLLRRRICDLRPADHIKSPHSRRRDDSSTPPVTVAGVLMR
jgi:hypothetical protein